MSNCAEGTEAVSNSDDRHYLRAAVEGLKCMCAAEHLETLDALEAENQRLKSEAEDMVLAAAYYERVVLHEAAVAENQQLREALVTIAGDGTSFAPCLPDCIEGSPTCGCAERRARLALDAT